MLPQVGKIVILAGGLTILLGVIFLFAGRIPLVGKLPGDILIKKENFSFYFPIAISVILSILLTSLLNVFGHFFRK